MLLTPKNHKEEKSELHLRNKHRERYNFKQLIECCTGLSKFVILNKYNNESIDFFNPEAVKLLNKSLLKCFYGIDYWDIPPNYLCPPIPGRADYIHYTADLLSECNKGKIPTGNKIKCLDVGVGANCVFPIIGNSEYGWSFVGSDIDKLSVESANTILKSNPGLIGNIEIRMQENSNQIFKNIILKDELIDLTICNPPFNSSESDSKAGNIRKLNNLKHTKTKHAVLNFGGQSNELWCEGGEKRFVGNMIIESKQVGNSCFWFSSLISKETTLINAYKELKNIEAFDIKTIPIQQGNKKSRILAWTFLNSKQQKIWSETRWK